MRPDGALPLLPLDFSFDTLALGCAALTVPADHLDKEFFELARSKGVTDGAELNCRYSAPPRFVRSKEPGVSGGCTKMASR
jgi:hypothetical protein